MSLKKVPPDGIIPNIRASLQPGNLCNTIGWISKGVKTLLREVINLARKVDAVIARINKIYGDYVDSLFFDIQVPELPTPAITALFSSALADCSLIPDYSDKLQEGADNINNFVNNFNNAMTDGAELWNNAMEGARQTALDANPFGQVKSMENQLEKLLNKKIPGINKTLIEAMAYLDALVACCDATILLVANASDQVGLFFQYFSKDGKFIRNTKRHGEKFKTGMDRNEDAANELLRKGGFTN